MNIFAITLGASRIEFSVSFENNKYVGKVNGKKYIESVDYELVRSSMLSGMSTADKIVKALH